MKTGTHQVVSVSSCLITRAFVPMSLDPTVGFCTLRQHEAGSGLTWSAGSKQTKQTNLDPCRPLRLQIRSDRLKTIPSQLKSQNVSDI